MQLVYSTAPVPVNWAKTLLEVWKKNRLEMKEESIPVMLKEERKVQQKPSFSLKEKNQVSY